MVALHSRCGHHFLPCGFFFLSVFFLFSSPNLSRRRLDVCHTSTHDVAFSANLSCRSETCCTQLAEIQDAKSRPKIVIWAYHLTTLSGYIFATKARIDNRKKKLVKQQYRLQMSHNMANFGPLAAEIDPVVWGTPANFNGFRILAASLYHGI